MAKKSPPSDLVDWTLSQAPDPAEPAPPAAGTDDAPQMPGACVLQRPRAARRFASKAVWRTGLILAGLVVLAFLAFRLSAAWDVYRLRRGVSQLVALEEQSTRLGDLDRLAQLYPQAAGGWAASQLQRAERGQPAPLPMTSLWPASEPGVVQSVTTLTADTARADVTRRFVAPNGSPIDFTQPQFYQFVSGTWRRIPPPADYRGAVRQWLGGYIQLTYYAVDEGLMLELGPYLDDKLARMCAAWDCPAGIQFDLRFLLDDATASRGFDYFSPAPGAPMIFGLLLSEREAFWSSPTMPLASPHLAGYPADTQSREAYERLLALEVLLRLVGRLTPASFRFSALPYALAARLSADLQLDAPNIRAIDFARPAFDPEELSALQYVSTARPLGPFYTKVAQYQALAAMNNLLEGQPPGIEKRLLQGLQSAADPAAWLADALEIPADSARAQLAASLSNLDKLPALAPIPGGQTLTLGCRGGLATFTAGEDQLRYFLPGPFADANPIAWSPDASRLLIDVSSQLAVVEAATGAVTWLPPTPDYFDQVQWVSSSVLAYTLWPRDLFRTAFDLDQFGLHYFDAAQPQRVIPGIPGIQSFALSPNRALAAVVQVNAQPSFSSQGAIAIMPALGGPLTFVDQGLSPAWSPDGRTLLYAQITQDAATLHTLDTATGTLRPIFTSAGWERRGQQFYLTASWSPTGERVLLALQGSYGNDLSVWTLRLDGADAVLVYDGAATAYTDPAHFSADGTLVAVTLWDPYWQRQTAIYNAATGERGVVLPDVGGWPAWAPAGHQLVMSTYEGIDLIADPANPKSQSERLADGVCYRALWNPAP